MNVAHCSPWDVQRRVNDNSTCTTPTKVDSLRNSQQSSHYLTLHVLLTPIHDYSSPTVQRRLGIGQCTHSLDLFRTPLEKIKDRVMQEQSEVEHLVPHTHLASVKACLGHNSRGIRAWATESLAHGLPLALHLHRQTMSFTASHFADASRRDRMLTTKPKESWSSFVQPSRTPSRVGTSSTAVDVKID
jgi:hypothetical protein